MAGIGGRSLSELPSSGALRALIGKDDAVPDGPLDMDYQRTVAEIVEQQQGAGYMYGKGALDKNDLLFLREQADREKEKELGLIESETLQYAALRARVEVSSEQAPMQASRQQPSAAALLAAAKAKEKHRPMLKLVAIAKKPRLGGAAGSESAVSMSADVLKSSNSVSQSSAAAAVAGGSSSSSNPSPPEPVTGGCAGVPPVCGSGLGETVLTGTTVIIEKAGSGLLGLFGDYDSDEDSEGKDDR